MLLVRCIELGFIFTLLFSFFRNTFTFQFKQSPDFQFTFFIITSSNIERSTRKTATLYPVSLCRNGDLLFLGMAFVLGPCVNITTVSAKYITSFRVVIFNLFVLIFFFNWFTLLFLIIHLFFYHFFSNSSFSSILFYCLARSLIRFFISATCVLFLTVFVLWYFFALFLYHVYYSFRFAMILYINLYSYHFRNFLLVLAKF